jgi:hypothetical protein
MAPDPLLAQGDLSMSIVTSFRQFLSTDFDTALTKVIKSN